MEAAQKTWELENSITLIDPQRDALYNYDAAAIKALNDAKPWRTDPRYFRHLRVSAVALLKMVLHARSGGTNEIMGLMQGYVLPHTFVVTDALRLPVEGTETRVNAQAEADEYMVGFLERARQAGQQENAVGWYHSHPGYGCWLSGIDVSTQMNQQMFQDPFCAVVIDPDRTISAGKVDIGAFRTLPEKTDAAAAAGDSGNAGRLPNLAARTPTDPADDEAEDDDGFQTIPLEKMEDFGAYSDRYYSLSISHFKSTLDASLLAALWNKYWVGTLAASPLTSNHAFATKQMAELARKMSRTEQNTALAPRRSYSYMGPASARAGAGAGADVGTKSGAQKPKQTQLEKVLTAGERVAAEESAGLWAAEIKARLFNGVGCAKEVEGQSAFAAAARTS